MHRLTHLCLLLCALAASTALADSMYKSLSPDGRVVYSDRPPVAGKLVKAIQFEPGPSTPLPSIYAEQLRRLRASAPAASSEPLRGVVLYSAVWCGYCKQAKAYLANRCIRYREIDIDSEDGKLAYAKAGGGQGVPLLSAGGRSIVGFSSVSYDQLFAALK
jgi:glutaredoxin